MRIFFLGNFKWYFADVKFKPQIGSIGYKIKFFKCDKIPFFLIISENSILMLILTSNKVYSNPYIIAPIYYKFHKSSIIVTDNKLQMKKLNDYRIPIHSHSGQYVQHSIPYQCQHFKCHIKSKMILVQKYSL